MDNKVVFHNTCVLNQPFFFWQIHLNLHEFIYIFKIYLCTIMYIYLYFMSLPSLPSVFFPKFACIYIINIHHTYLYICNMYSNLIPKTHRISRISGPQMHIVSRHGRFRLGPGHGSWWLARTSKMHGFATCIEGGLEDRCGRYAPHVVLVLVSWKNQIWLI